MPESLSRALFEAEVTDEHMMYVRNSVLPAIEPGIWRAFQLVFELWNKSTDHNNGGNGNNGEAAGLSLWRILKEKSINLRAFTVVIYVMIKAQNKVSFVVASTYLSMLSLPGSLPVFNAIVLRSSMNLIKLWARTELGTHTHNTHQHRYHYMRAFYICVRVHCCALCERVWFIVIITRGIGQ